MTAGDRIWINHWHDVAEGEPPGVAQLIHAAASVGHGETADSLVSLLLLARDADLVRATQLVLQSAREEHTGDVGIRRMCELLCAAFTDEMDERGLDVW